MTDSKRFVFDKGGGGPSQPVGLTKVMEAEARQLKVGAGAFVVTRGGQYHHPDLSRAVALKVSKENLKAIPVDSGITVRDAKGELVFHAKRVATNPYKNPFRDAAISPARIDAGVDFCGSGGPIYALGNGIVTTVGTPSNSNVFGDNGMTIYQLTQGPAASKFVFFAEHYYNAPGLHVGMAVTSDTVLYHMTGCIEIGWSDGRGSMAWDTAGRSIEGERTAWGDNFSRLLESVDCVPGLTLGRSTTMTLPKDWPTW